MKQPLFQQVLAPDTLNRAWKALSTDHAVWDAGIPRADMERDALRHILTLRDEVAFGRYRPAPLRRFSIAKADGRRRVLTALCLRDKLLQKAVQLVLEPRAERLFHHDSYAYRPRRNVDMALERTRERIRCGLHWLVDADIHGFFDNIPHGPLKRCIERFVRDKPLTALIHQWIDAGAAHTSLLGKARGIPQGAILSPLCCNLYLHPFDAALADRHIPFVRYADDFLLFTETEAQAQAALVVAEQALRGLDLDLHPQKTRVVRSHPQVEFLGQRLPDANTANPLPTKAPTRRKPPHARAAGTRPKAQRPPPPGKALKTDHHRSGTRRARHPQHPPQPKQPRNRR
ncbi:reverse transcriptase domain-containing protein [uncultured Thiohalocapsa sp.]|uniref:reverse transcriptase domain-containing protein n=1 Tax=uncultured Thiohalocapsa sp. TaxID=768990 RepID=UPI0025D2C3A1|nr:reverse transcriptase domain-containing protein [uncultured Thiohalocapsa sp.]